MDVEEMKTLATRLAVLIGKGEDATAQETQEMIGLAVGVSSSVAINLSEIAFHLGAISQLMRQRS